MATEAQNKLETSMFEDKSTDSREAGSVSAPATQTEIQCGELDGDHSRRRNKRKLADDDGMGNSQTDPYVYVGRMIVFSLVGRPTGSGRLLGRPLESDLHHSCLSCMDHEAVGFLGYLRSRLAFHDSKTSYGDLIEREHT